MASVKAFIFLFSILAGTGMAFAASGTLTVAAIVPLSNGNCSVTTAQNIAFGALNPLVPQSVVSAAGSLTYTCKGLGHAGATVSVTLSSPTPLTLKHSGSPTYNIPYLVELPSASFVPGN